MYLPCDWRLSGSSAIFWNSPEKNGFMSCFPAMNGFISFLRTLYETYGKRDTYSMYLSRKDFFRGDRRVRADHHQSVKGTGGTGLISRDGWNIVMTWEQYQRIRKLVRVQNNETGE